MERQLTSTDPLTIDIVESGVVSWEDLLRTVRTFHYGRNLDRSNLSIVWYERKGSCSSKHAFLKHVADLNKLEDIELVLCMYRMNSNNTAKIGTVLEKYQLEFLPEAHCYLKDQGNEIDVTTMNSDFEMIANDIIEEEIIDAEQVIEYKVNYHKEFMKNWVQRTFPSKKFDDLWEIREECIYELSKT